jgi:hypothetical protein
MNAAFMSLEHNAGQAKLIVVRSRLAPGGGRNRNRTSVTPASAAPDQTAWVPHPCSPSDMAAAPMQYEQAADLVSGATAAPGRPCGITDTTARPACPLKIKIS